MSQDKPAALTFDEHLGVRLHIARKLASKKNSNEKRKPNNVQMMHMRFVDSLDNLRSAYEPHP